MISETLILWLANALIIAGAFFALTSAVGLLRFPDFFTRLHPAGVADSLGTPCILAGLMLHAGLTLISGKILLLLLFLLVTTPTACHALAKAAHLEEGQENPDKPKPAAGEPDKLKPKGEKG